MQTDLDGKINIDTYKAGVYVFTVRHGEYETKEFRTDSLPGASDERDCNIEVEWEMEKNFCNKTTDPVSLKVTVVDETTSDIIEGADLTIYIDQGINPISTTSDENGVSFVEVTEDGIYVIEANAEGMKPVSITKNVTCDPKDCGKCKPVATVYLVPVSEDSTIPPPDESCDTEIENSLTVLPIDKTNDKPIPDAEITITYNDKYIAKKVGLTNSSYKTPIKENGLYIINGTSVGYLPKTVEKITNCGRCQENDIDLYGNDIKAYLNIPTWADCADLCAKEEGCTHWTWASPRYEDPSIFYKCHLKNSDSGREMIDGLISGGENCDQTTCHNCLNEVKLYLEPDVCEETDFTVSVFEDITRTPIVDATVIILDVSKDPPRIISKNLVCPTADMNREPCGWEDISELDCSNQGCCFNNATCTQKVETKPMKTDVNGEIVAPSPGEAKLKITVAKEGYEVLNGTSDVFCQHPCDGCNPSFTAIVKEKLCEDKDIIEFHVTVTDGTAPIPEASVAIKLTSSIAGPASKDTSKEMLTNKEGRVDPPIFVKGTYIITATAEGFDSKTKEIKVDEVKACGDDIPVEIPLKALKDEDHCRRAGIGVFVFNPDIPDMPGVSGVSVLVKSDGQEIATDETDADGFAAIRVSENAEYTISVTKEGFTGNEKTATIQYPEECFVEADFSITEEKCPLTEMKIVVINNSTDEKLPGVEVTVIQTKSISGTSISRIEKPKYTDDNGTVYFNVPMNGDYKVRATIDGFDPVEVEKNVMCDTKDCEGCAPVVTIHTPPSYCSDKYMRLITRDCKTDEILKDAIIKTTVETVDRGVVEWGTQKTPANGEILIPITENGIYNSIITLDGYEVMKNSFEVALTMDDCDEFNPIDIVPLCEPVDPECTSVSLSWTNEEDIDLEAFRVNKLNTNDTCNTKPQCCEGCKKETCEGVIESTDTEGSTDGLPGGTETITYCNTDDYSNMIYVSDPSEEGNSLPNSGAKIVITHGEEEQIIRIDETKPSKDSKFWVAGCLTTDRDSFNFIELNKFTEGKPSEENPLFCYDRVNIEKKTKEDTPLEDASIVVNIFDADTSDPISGAIIQASTSKESISRLSKDTGEVAIKVTKNGVYSVEASARGYVNSKATVTLDCPTNSGIPRMPCIRANVSHNYIF